MKQINKKLIIIDGHALIHRSFHALPPTLRTKSGQLVNAVYGFSSFLLKALKEFSPDYVVLTLDKPGPTFRHEVYEEYKATRVKAPDELYEQIPLVKEVAQAFNIPILELTGFEGDDLIGTICELTKSQTDLTKIIITGDLDTLQLVGPQVKVYTMSRGLNDSVLYDEAKVQERYGLTASQIIDYKALRGDVSDNIPGVKGIGEKTAQELLATFGSLAGVYQAVAKNDPRLKPRILGLLQTHQADAFLSQELATINLQAPIKFSLPAQVFAEFSKDQVFTLFSRLEFKSLLTKVRGLHTQLNPQDSAATESLSLPSKPGYQLINTEAQLKSLLTKLKTRTSITINLATNHSDPLEATLLGISFAWQEQKAYFVPAQASYLAKLKPFLESAKLKKSGHNLKFAWRVLAQQEIFLQGLFLDTLIAAYLLNPGHQQTDLDNLIFSELGLERDYSFKSSSSSATQLSLLAQDLDLEKLSLKTNEEADLIARLAKILEKKLTAKKLWQLFSEIEIPLLSVLGKMENRGINFNPQPLNLLNQQVTKKLNSLEKNIQRLAGENFNLNSPKQLQRILFEILELPTENIKKTKTGFSTAEEELEKLNDVHEIVPELREYRELNKLQTTYLNSLPKEVNPRTGRIHSNFNQTITTTGRLSSSSPNLQNIPTRTSEGQKIRQAFIPAPGCLFLSFDYSQIELRLSAHLSGDKKMIAAFINQEDIHTATAAEINHLPPSEVTKNMRREAKAINFGILYGQGIHGLSQATGLSYYQANEFIKRYFAAYPKIKLMVNNFIKQAQETGQALTMFGRQRPLPEINSQIPSLRRSAERMAINTPIQGAAADLIKLAMIKIDDLINDHPEEINLILQIHDELIFEVKQDRLDFYAPQLKKIMESLVNLQVPIIAEESRGNNWGDLG
ncbi:MAG: DNA polymerase I [Patescibacteria group bacterium]|jgi:DNA polymerase-1